MGISSSSSRRVRRITIGLREDLVEALDGQVAAGVAVNRTELISDAIAREVKRLRNAAIDAEILALANDPEYQRLDEQLEKEFAAADAEAWAMLDEEFGAEPTR
ncbi:MAG: ribbon-helix-helix domain-containing protein [bacterium]